MYLNAYALNEDFERFELEFKSSEKDFLSFIGFDSFRSSVKLFSEACQEFESYGTEFKSSMRKIRKL